MKQRAVFLMCATEQESGRAPFFHNTAFYLLKSYLDRCEEIRERWEIEILEFTPPGAFRTSFLDRNNEKLMQALTRNPPRIVAFSLYVWNVSASHQLARSLRQMLGNALMMAGGPEVAWREEFVETFPAFDVAIEGDGELPLRRVLQALSSVDGTLAGIPNVSFRGADGAFVHNESKLEFENMDSLPNFYADYPDKLRGPAFFLTSRGCCNHCTYCLWAKQGLRQRSPAKVLEELETIVDSAASPLTLWDYDLLELYLTDPATLEAITALLRKRPSMSVEFFINPKLLVDPRLRQLIASMNVSTINVGLQSADTNALRLAGRPWSARSIETMLEVADDLKPLLVVELIYPLPGETLASFVAMIRKLVAAGYFRFKVFPLMLLRGTALARDPERLGMRRMAEPPYYCYQTAEVSHADYLDMGALSYVLSSLSEIWFDHPKLPVMRQWFVGNQDFLDGILDRSRAGVPLDDILGEVLGQIFGAASLEHYAGAERVNGYFAALSSPPGRPAREPARGDGEVVSGGFPPVEAIRALFRRKGLHVVDAWFVDRAMRLVCTHGQREFRLEVRPREVEGPCFSTTGRYKLSYEGELHDMRIMSFFAACIQRLEREMPG